MILLDHTDGHMRYYHRHDKNYSAACVLERDCFRGPSVMVWVAISFHGLSELTCFRGNLTGHRYRYEILAPVVVPFFNANRNVTLFKQDNVRCHTARVSMSYLDEEHVSVLPWPAFSPDLSPIEHLWDVLDCHVGRHHDPQNADQLEEFFCQEWEPSLYMKSRTLFHSCADAALLSLTQIEGTHGIEHFVTS